MIEEMIGRVIKEKKDTGDYELGVILFHRLLVAFSLLRGNVPADLLVLNDLANSHPEIEEIVSKLENRSGLSRGFEEELGFFSRLVKDAQKDCSR